MPDDLLHSEELQYRVMFNDFVKQTGDRGAGILGVIGDCVGHLGFVLKPLDHSLQQDLINDTAMSMLSNASYINDIGPRRVLYTIVRNRYIDMLRKESRRQEIIVYSEFPEADQTGDPPPPAHWEEGRYLTLECLDKIFNEAERQSGNDEDIRILTSYAMGHSYEEIADHSKRSINAVGQRISGLRKKLRELHKTLC